MSCVVKAAQECVEVNGERSYGECRPAQWNTQED